ncbi:TniB family NTP-binding protein, partial [Neisseria lactamica]|uniref:TniB family NTP-binding protein n=1 Tax=Neisseria lactamica TaxID=486 RepID=UPI003FD6D6CD
MSLLERFYIPYRATDSIAKLRYQTIHLFHEYKVEMLIIDEFYSLLVGTPRLQRQVMNAIKILCNELQIPIVGVGTKDAIRVLHTYPQHASRFDVAELPTWKLDQVIDWQPIEQYLNRQKTRYLRDHCGRPAYPLLSMFKAVLPGQWHSLSDPELEHS